MPRRTLPPTALIVVLALLWAAPPGAASEHAQPAADGNQTTDPLNATLPLDGGPGIPGIGDVLAEPGGIIAVSLGGIAVAVLLAWPIERVAISIVQAARIADPGKALEHDTRRGIYDFLTENPGTHFRALQRELDLANATLRWHLDKLEAVGLIASQRSAGKRIYYVNGASQGARPAVLQGLLENDNVVRILAYLRANPDVHASQIAEALDLNQMTVRWHVNKLLKEGFVTERPNGRGTLLRISGDDAPLVQRALDDGVAAAQAATA